MQYGCIGEHLSHSFSAEIHAMLADYKYEMREIAPSELEDFLAKRDFWGINVTIPYKEAVIPYLDFVDENAKKIGAVNTIVNRDGKLYGYNTDFFGMSALIRRLGIEVAGKKVVILGTGGTSRTARAVAESMGAEEIVRISRRGGNGAVDYQELYDHHTDAQIIINTTPCGMYPYADGGADRAATPVDISRFTSLCGVVDAVYNPLRTNFIMDAIEKGIAAEGGLYMLVAQAIRASEIFLDTEYPAYLCERVYSKILAQKENIVLCGMPASGKSTVGKLIADITGRELFDTDELIVDRIGMTISEFFSENGETAFRNVESSVIKEDISHLGGSVVATGGGAILRDENVRALKRNGRLVFLDRPLSDLIPTADRPLASDADAIRKRYGERYDRYLSTSDIRVKVCGEPKDVADTIVKELEA